jgi:hypothetical protein
MIYSKIAIHNGAFMWWLWSRTRLFVEGGNWQ